MIQLSDYCVDFLHFILSVDYDYSSRAFFLVPYMRLQALLHFISYYLHHCIERSRRIASQLFSLNSCLPQYGHNSRRPFTSEHVLFILLLVLGCPTIVPNQALAGLVEFWSNVRMLCWRCFEKASHAISDMQAFDCTGWLLPVCL